MFVLSTDKNGYPGFGNVSLEDIQRRNSIAFLLMKWNMITIVNPSEIEPHTTKIEVVPYKDKKKYQLVKKFNTENLNNF